MTVPTPAVAKKKIHWAVAVVATVLAALAVYVNVVVIPISQPAVGLGKNSIDLLVYMRSGEHVMTNTPLYAGGLVGRLPFTYPPFAALLFASIGWVKFSVMRWIAFGLNLLILAVIIGWCLRSLGYRYTVLFYYTTVMMTLASVLLNPVRDTLLFGQINLFLMLLITAGLLAPRRQWASGVAIGVAAGIKLTPIFFFLVLMIQRRWKALGMAIGGFLATVIVGFAILPHDSERFWRGMFMDDRRVGSYLNLDDQSVQAVVYRLAGGHTRLWLVAEALVFILIVVALWYTNRRRNDVLIMAMGGLGACLMSPFSWVHHYIWVVPLFIAAGDMLLRRGPVPGQLLQSVSTPGYKARWISARVVIALLVVGMMVALGTWVMTTEDGSVLVGVGLLSVEYVKHHPIPGLAGFLQGLYVWLMVGAAGLYSLWWTIAHLLEELRESVR